MLSDTSATPCGSRHAAVHVRRNSTAAPFPVNDMTTPKRPLRGLGAVAVTGRTGVVADRTIAPVYQPLPQVDSRNIGSFRDAVTDSAERYGFVVVDCSCVLKMGVSAM